MPNHPSGLVAPEHLDDVVEISNSEYPDQTPGIWRTIDKDSENVVGIMFVNLETNEYIVIGVSDNFHPVS